ncbi:MAG: siderophore-interacting protein [Marmoricola sp.]
MSTRPGFVEAEVRSRTPLSDHLVRIVLGGAGLGAFRSTGIPDEWVALVVPGQFQSRYYTVRSWNGSELTLDIVVHDEGLVTEWALTDCVGDVVSVSEPKGSYLPAADASWIVLLGDLTALPAIARILENSAQPVQAFISSPDGPIDGYADGISWLPGDVELATFVEQFTWPEGSGYFWMAGESAQMRQIRRHVRRDLGWDASRQDLMGYWSNTRARQSRAVDPGPIYRRGKAQGLSDEQIWAQYDEEASRG